jgi:hypothetical protein
MLMMMLTPMPMAMAMLMLMLMKQQFLKKEQAATQKLQHRTS